MGSGWLKIGCNQPDAGNLISAVLFADRGTSEASFLVNVYENYGIGIEEV